MSAIEKAIARHKATRNHKELLLNSLRYETIRRLKIHEFKMLCDRNLGGERFDDLVDSVTAEHENKFWK